MTDDRVDELLADLDRALSVEPSPVVAASVRARRESPRSIWMSRLWVPAAAAAVVLASAGAVLWQRPSDPRGSAMTVTQASALREEGVSAPAAAGPSEFSSRGAAARGGGAPRATNRSGWPQQTPGPLDVNVSPASPSAAREPEVIVSADQRIAFEQLRAAIRDGRLSADSFVAVTPSEPPGPLTITSVLITPYKADVVVWSDDEKSGD